MDSFFNTIKHIILGQIRHLQCEGYQAENEVYHSSFPKIFFCKSYVEGILSHF